MKKEDGLNPFPLKDLKTSSIEKEWCINCFIEEFQSVSPVKGYLTAKHQGDSLLIRARFQTITSLTCDRCMKTFNHELNVDCEELILIANNRDQNIKGLDPKSLEMLETLHPNADFDPERWIFEHLSLELPIFKLCDKDCESLTFFNAIHDDDKTNINSSDPKKQDPRWDALKKLL